MLQEKHRAEPSDIDGHRLASMKLQQGFTIGEWGPTVILRSNNPQDQMSALGHQRTFRRVRLMSAVPSIADSKRTFSYVRSGPISDIGVIIRSPRRRGREG